jgi:hypothetical protein
MHRFSSLRSDEDGVTKYRRSHDDKAYDERPLRVLVQYAEEPEEAQHSKRG